MKVRSLAYALITLPLLWITPSHCVENKPPANRTLSVYRETPGTPFCRDMPPNPRGRPSKPIFVPGYHLYAAPFFQDINSRAHDKHEHDSSEGMWGINAGFEYMPENTFYLGGEFSYGVGAKHTALGRDDIEVYYLEDRIGYTFSSCAPSLGPFNCSAFIGVGYQHFHQRLEDDLKRNNHFWYVPLGLRIRQNFSENFFAGLNGEIAPTFGGGCSNGCKRNAPIKFLWKIELPLTYTFDWFVGKVGLSLVPYYNQWAFKNTRDFDGQLAALWGARLEIGYYF